MTKKQFSLQTTRVADKLNELAKSALTNPDIHRLVDFDLIYKLESHLRDLPKLFEPQPNRI